MASEQAGGLQPVELRHRFFESMFDSVAIRRPGFRIPKFGYENWVGFAAGPFGFYDVAFTANGAVRAGVYLDMQERTATKRLFDDLFAERLAVETAVGRILSWERLDDRRASRIVDYREVRDLDSLADRRALADWAAETVVKLMEALDDRLRSTAQVLLSRVQGGVEGRPAVTGPLDPLDTGARGRGPERSTRGLLLHRRGATQRTVADNLARLVAASAAASRAPT